MDNCKIGLHIVGYQTAEYFRRAILPWCEYKEKHKNLVISAGHCVFKEFADLGFPVKSTDGTHELFEEYTNKGVIDYYRFFPKPLIEAEARSIVLSSLIKESVSFVWLWALDELYTLEEIEKTVGYIQKNQFITWFRIHFKNLTFSEKTFVKGFTPPRIFRHDKNYQLLHFFADDEPIFKDKNNNHISYLKLPSLTIPENICNPLHYTWLNNKRSKDKCLYQSHHFGNGNTDSCSYKWNNEKDRLEFNENYYKLRGQSLPELFNME